MSYGFKAYSNNIETPNSLVIDDSFSSWQTIQSGQIPGGSQVISLDLENQFNQSSNTAPALFIKFPSQNSYAVSESSFYAETQPYSETVTGFVVSDSSFLIPGTSSVQGLSYRLYRQLDLSNQQLVTNGYGINVFNSNGKPVFSSNVNPLTLNAAGIIDFGYEILPGFSNQPAGYYGTEYDTGLFEPWVFMSFAAKRTIIPIGTINRLVYGLVPVFYHTNGTLKIRFYVARITVAGPPAVTYSSVSGNIQQTFFCFFGTKPE